MVLPQGLGAIIPSTWSTLSPDTSLLMPSPPSGQGQNATFSGKLAAASLLKLIAIFPPQQARSPAMVIIFPHCFYYS